MDCSLPGSSVHWILQARLLEWVAFLLSRGSSQPTIEPKFLTLHVILHHLSHQGSPKNSGMGSHSFLQWIFLNQESNRGVLHCRQILCQLSYQGSPYKWEEWYKSHDFQRHPWQATHQVSLTCLAKSDKLSFACLTTLVLSAQGIFKSLFVLGFNSAYKLTHWGA